MINVTKTYLPDREKYIQYVNKIFNSGWLTNNGELVQELEKRLSEYLQVENLLLIGNATMALQIAYKVFGLKGDIITTPFSFVATTSSMVWEGLNPVFADIDGNTFNIDPANIEKALTPASSAIVPVHVFGNSCNIEQIEEIAKKHNLKIIYDAAHSFGVNYKGKGIGSYGDASVFSFHSAKIFHTVEGGAIAFRKKEDLEKAKLMRNFGIPGPDRITELGINCKMNEFEAAMGLCMLDEMSIVLEKRSKVYSRYTKALTNLSEIKLQLANKDNSKNFSYFPVVFESEQVLLNVKGALQKENIIPRRYFYPSLNTLPYIKSRQVMALSESVSSRILCLPLYETLGEKDQDRIIEIIKSNL